MTEILNDGLISIGAPMCQYIATACYKEFRCMAYKCPCGFRGITGYSVCLYYYDNGKENKPIQKCHTCFNKMYNDTKQVGVVKMVKLNLIDPL